jgi:NADH-quinone oxidoreductase subunit J
MLTDTLLFYAFAAIAVAGGVLTITLRNAIHCAISLIFSLLGVAGLYLLLQAEFLFAVQIILYVGGIMLLFLFVIMLVNLDQEAKARQFHRSWIVALIAVGAVAAELGYFLYRGRGAFQLAPAAAAGPVVGNTQALADSLFSEYLLPFELVSVLLLVAVVGSVLMAKKRV